jgi:Flp pilus assembly protein TadG
MKPQRRKSQRGNALVEFTLGWFLLWTIFSGVYGVGYALYVYNELMASVSNAALLAANLGYDTGDPTTYTNEIKNMVVYGDTTAGTNPRVPNLTASNVSVTMNPAGGIPQDVTINITGYSIPAIFTSFTLTNKPRATVRYTGLISCSTC